MKLIYCAILPLALGLFMAMIAYQLRRGTWLAKRFHTEAKLLREDATFQKLAQIFTWTSLAFFVLALFCFLPFYPIALALTAPALVLMISAAVAIAALKVK